MLKESFNEEEIVEKQRKKNKAPTTPLNLVWFDSSIRPDLACSSSDSSIRLLFTDPTPQHGFEGAERGGRAVADQETSSEKAEKTPVVADLKKPSPAVADLKKPSAGLEGAERGGRAVADQETSSEKAEKTPAVADLKKPSPAVADLKTPSDAVALDKSKYRDGLRAVRKYIPRLEQDLELLKEQAKLRYENKAEVSNENQDEESSKNEEEGTASLIKCTPDELGAMIDGNDDSYDEDSVEESGLMSDSEPLSDMFETDTDEEVDSKLERPLYLDEFEKFPVEDNGESEDFEEHLRHISLNSKKGEKSAELPELDEDEESSKNEQEGTASRIKCTPDELGAMIDGNDDSYDEDSIEESGLTSDSEPLSDMFETDTDEEVDGELERPLYLDEFEKFPVEDNGELEDFKSIFDRFP
ncbi:hypothetical protein Syun_030396 [Stephania yunnanensis]|uniref:Uncharacterized protein n=1 Tax=Stephania yunnanensis TaxID=152371 RepID=A0AAP0HKG7_9MAGN